MDTSLSTTQIARRGFNRVVTDFTKKNEAVRLFLSSGPDSGSAPIDGRVDLIHFHRYGVSYGAPLNNFIGIRVHFSYPKGLPALSTSMARPAMNLSIQAGTRITLRSTH